ncbi:Ku protein [Streptomyces sp. BE20]|uniref:Ku protein n=1 Tax=Streptomyces sp. BE20 TaxID=3002525 RepID=UPI002E76666D|nr:Ku protein [Streptomyces sp. BE20]
MWTGVLTFGLVTVPVALYTATSSHDVRFHQLQRGTSDRVRNKRVNARCTSPTRSATPAPRWATCRRRPSSPPRR